MAVCCKLCVVGYTCALIPCYAHHQDIHAEQVKKRRRATSKPYSRSIVGASLEVIQKKRAEKTEVRAAAREAALKYDKSVVSCDYYMNAFIFGTALLKNCRIYCAHQHVKCLCLSNY